MILINGAYGHRQVTICKRLGILCETMEWSDSQAVDVEAMLARLREDAKAAGGKPSFTHVSLIHHETTAGIINPLESLAKALKAEFPGVSLLVDSMSGFGAYDLRMDWGIDFAVSSSNKCIEGVPGFSFALCNRGALEKAEGNARSLALDLHDQWKNMEATGQFRFTPPTHALLAFHQALVEFEAEGWTEGRAARYKANYEVIARSMEELGFKFYVDEGYRSYLIITFLEPEHPNFDFQAFYRILAEGGFVIYPGKLAQAASFRFGTIGRLFPSDCESLIAAVKSACTHLKVPLPLR